MTESPNKAVLLALLTLAKALDTSADAQKLAASALRTIVGRELEIEPTEPQAPCVPPVLGEAAPVEGEVTAASTNVSPAPEGGDPVLEYNDTVNGVVWVIDEAGNVVRNGRYLYSDFADPAKSLSLIGDRLWFRTSSERWYVVGVDNVPTLQSTQPGTE